MTSKERVGLILNHREADRPAIDLGGSSVTGTSAWNHQALRELLGLPPKPIRAFDLFQMLAEVEDDVKEALGCDVDLLPKENLALGLHGTTWKSFTFWSGQTFEVPGDFEPEVTQDGALETHFGPGGPRMRMPQGGRFFDFVPNPEADSFGVPHIPEEDWSFVDTLDPAFLERERARAEKLAASTDRAILAEPPFGTPVGYAGLYQWGMKMMTDPEHCRAYMMKNAEAVAQCARQYMETVGDIVDVVAMNLADFGHQDREVFDPDLFGEFYVPAWKVVHDVIHEWPGVKTWIHCCGSVPNLIPHFIASGVDCLNPVQWTAEGMDLETLKARYGDDIVFWGGAISTQRTLPFGTPEDVAREARDVLDIMAPGGGYVFNPIHNNLPEVTPANIAALFETAKDYRYNAAPK
jgi:hypothetical protein